MLDSHPNKIRNRNPWLAPTLALRRAFWTVFQLPMSVISESVISDYTRFDRGTRCPFEHYVNDEICGCW